jgi:VIT1/CCC1 family predicted Fe2+/Mn2+ transporter
VATRRQASKYDTAVVREFLASALYVAIVLWAALAAIPSARIPDRTNTIALMLGTAFGLTLAHWFAFRLASGLSDESGVISKHASQEALAQMAGGMTISVIAALPYLFFSGHTAWAISVSILGGLLALTGLAIARLRRWSWFWTIAASVAIVLLGALIVLVKTLLVH